MTDTIASNTPSDRALSIMLWIVATGFFMQTLDSTIVNTALPPWRTVSAKRRCACGAW